MEDFEHSEKEAEDFWVHQEKYLKAPLVKIWFRKYLGEIREISDDELINRLKQNWSFNWSMYVDNVWFSLSDLDYALFNNWEATRRMYLSREFKWRLEFANEQFARKTSDKFPEIWDFMVLNPDKELPDELKSNRQMVFI